MWKFLTAGTAALAIASAFFLYAGQSSFLYAQQPSGSDEGQLWQHGVEDLHEFDEARLAALNTGLMLTPDQQKNWPAFEQAAHDFGKQRIDRRMTMRSAAPTPDPVERMRRRATAMSKTSAALKQLADATEPLYMGLDDHQKQRFRSTQSPDWPRPGSFPQP